MKQRIQFDGVDGRAGGRRGARSFRRGRRQFRSSNADRPAQQLRRGGVRRNANGARDLFAPVGIGEEMLAEALASHGSNSVAGSAPAGSRRVVAS